MYKGRFQKEGGRSTADLLRERAQQAAPHPQPGPAPQQAPAFQNPAGPGAPIPQDPVSPQPGGFSDPRQAAPAVPNPGGFQQPQQRPVTGPGGMPIRPGYQNAPQQPGLPPRPPMGPGGMAPGTPQQPQQRPVMGPGGMPIRPGYQNAPQQPGVPPRPVMSPGGMPPPQRPQQPQQRPVMGPGGMPIRPGYQNAPQQPGVPPRPPMGPGGMPPQQRPAAAPGGVPRPGFQGAPQRPGNVRPAAQRPVPHPNPQKAPAPQPEAAADTRAAKVRKGSITFYTCYFGFIFLFFLVTFFGLTWLKGWLTDFEAAQPYTMAEQIFNANFADPDWKIIYQNSTAFAEHPEDCDTYVALMEEKVGSSQLTYQETSAGLSGDKKYFIKLGDERIASFTLQGDSKFITDIPDWTLGEIEVMVNYDNSYRIQMQEGHTAYVNGKALDESHTIMKASTKAQEFLPVGTQGIRIWTQQVDGLMGRPTVVVKDKKGQEIPVSYDEATKTFTEQSKLNTISDAQRDAVIGAAKVYGQYMIAQAGRGELAKFFDASSKIYSSIRDSEKIVQKAFFSSYDFGTPEISNFTMYSDDLFSAQVNITLNVTRTDGTVKPFPIDVTLFFSQHATGKWLAFDMTNEPVNEPIGQVRLTFKSDDGTVLASDFYDTDAQELDAPMITVPEGKVFGGWVRHSVSDEGKKVLEVVFNPDETGHVVLPKGTQLEPMVLTPYFENAQGGA